MNSQTPNLDKLAAHGAQLEQFYVQPICTPTRASLLTGRYPLRYGLQTAVIPSSHTYGLPTDEWLLPQALKEAGYINAHDVSNPMFLYLTFNAPHTPYQATPEYLDKYEDVTDPSRQAYSAMVNAMDDQVGHVITALEQKGLRENRRCRFQ